MARNIRSKSGMSLLKSCLVAAATVTMAFFSTGCGSDGDSSSRCGDGELRAQVGGEVGCFKTCTTVSDCATGESCSGNPSICRPASTGGTGGGGTTDPPPTGTNNTPQPNVSAEDLALCQDYCHLIYGCLDTACTLTGTSLAGQVPGFVQECVYGDASDPADTGCVGLFSGNQAAQARAELTEFSRDASGNRLSCDTTSWIRCGIFPLGDLCGCQPPSNLGSACANDDQCNGGSLFGACIAETGADGTPSGYPGGMCLASPCPVLLDNAGDVYEGFVCGAGGACLHYTNQQGRLSGLCLPSCDSHSDCRQGYACQPLGPSYELTQQGAQPVGIAKTCEPRCSDANDCGQGARCNSTSGACEFSCEQDQADELCALLGGTCQADGEGAPEYCVLP
jgi:hypothetical protein